MPSPTPPPRDVVAWSVQCITHYFVLWSAMCRPITVKFLWSALLVLRIPMLFSGVHYVLQWWLLCLECIMYYNTVCWSSSTVMVYNAAYTGVQVLSPQSYVYFWYKHTFFACSVLMIVYSRTYKLFSAWVFLCAFWRWLSMFSIIGIRRAIFTPDKVLYHQGRTTIVLKIHYRLLILLP